MKQVIQNMRSGKTSVIEVPKPVVQPGTALVRTVVSLVSAGTERMVVQFAEKSLIGKARSRPDLVRQVITKAQKEGILTTIEAAFNRLDQPMALGYSSAGTIEALGEGISGFQVGQRVACAGGNYAVHAEYSAVPKNLLAPLPDHVDFESAAFTTLGAIALHGFRLAEIQLGEKVAVIGLGLLGMLCVQIAVAAGCQVLGVDLDPERVSLAAQFGATAVHRDLAVEAAQAFGDGQGSDAVLICADAASSDPVELAGEIARDRARVIAVGAVGQQLPRKTYFEKELTFINSRSYGPGRYDPTYEESGLDYPIGYVRWTEGRNLQAFVDLLSKGRVNVHPLISHRFPISDAVRAYETITGKSKQPFLGVLLQYSIETEMLTGLDQKLEKNGTLLEQDLENQISTRTGKDPKFGQVKLGVIGAGNFANAVLLPAIKECQQIERTAITSANGLNAKHAANRYRFKYTADDINQILADPEINAIAILTRHHLHAAQILAGLEAGKHVFCEKPLAITNEEIDQIADKLYNQTETKPILMVGYNRRFSQFGKMLHHFWQDRQEPIAVNYRINAGYIPKSHWVHDPIQGGGRIIGEACHFIDFITFLIGTPPSAVFGSRLPDQGRYQGDNCILVFDFPDGSVGTISYLANGDKAFSKERVEIFGCGRVSVLDDFRSLEMVQNGKRNRHASRLRQDKGHHGEWLEFAGAIEKNTSPPIPYDQLIGVSRAALAGVEALKTMQKVHLPT